MKTSYLFQLLVFLVLFRCQNKSNTFSPYSDNQLLRSAQVIVNDFHAGKRQGKYVVKIVYFHGKGQVPLSNWNERLTRVLADVNFFYKQEFSRYGIDIDGVPFEKQSGTYKFYVVEGDSVSSKYTTDSGSIITNEIHDKTNGSIDFSSDYVLIINALSYKKANGTYVFHSPYYGTWGWGSSERGMCQVADSEMLDSDNLKKVNERMVFSERSIENKECSVAEFNSWYIGGIAHEMGHMFGLRHDFGNPSEFSDSSISLMGEKGSLHYREYLWNGKKTSQFSAAAILQLISHPVFTQSNFKRDLEPLVNTPIFTLKRQQEELKLEVALRGDNLPYGAVALFRPFHLSEYYSQSFSSLVQADGTIKFNLGQRAKGVYSLKLLMLFRNGKVMEFNKGFDINGEGNAKDITRNGALVLKDFYDSLLMKDKSPNRQLKMEVLQSITNPLEPIEAKKYSGKSLYLSDVKWEKANVGWGQVARNFFSKESEQTLFLENQGKLYKKGLYAHSPSSYEFDLDGKWDRFSAVVGLRDHAGREGSAKFKLLGDSKVIYESSALVVNQKSVIDVSIKDIKKLELVTEKVGENHTMSWAVWFEPKVERRNSTITDKAL